MKIIFLDIDGVLVTDRSRRFGRWSVQGPFDLVAVSNLNKLIDATNARVVISSAWRTDSSLNMKTVLGRAGVECEIVGQTPVLGGRAFEIAVWLFYHRNRIDRFVIIDDTRDSILCDRFSDKLVSTTMETGFDKTALCRAQAILRGEKVSSIDPGLINGMTTFEWGRQ